MIQKEVSKEVSRMGAKPKWLHLRFLSLKISSFSRDYDDFSSSTSWKISYGVRSPDSRFKIIAG